MSLRAELVLLGVLLLALLLFQIALGMRWIKIKGRRHWAVHKWTAWGMLVLAAYHALRGLTFVGIISMPF